MSTDTTALELLEAAALAARTQPTSREAIEFVVHDVPADYVRAIPVRTLVEQAPELPALAPLNQRSITGKTIEALLAAGPTAAVVQTARGIRVAQLDDRLANDPAVIVLTAYDEAAAACVVRKNDDGSTIPGQRPVDFAREVLMREQDAADYATAA